VSAALSAPALETWCIVTDVTNDVGTVKSVHAGADGYDDAIMELEHPDELWLRFDAPPVGSHIFRRERRSA
jgi:hypothetical protein